MTGTITTTVTFEDLITSYDDELEELREAYEDVVEYATEEYGENRGEWPEDARGLAEMYNESGMAIQSRRHVLETLRDRYDSGAFEIKMLTGAELMDIETELRMEAQKRDVEISTLQTYRQQLTADAATIDAPDGVPTGDGSPVPSEAPNALALAIYEHVERFNNAGAADFRAPGFADRPTLSKPSDRPTPSSETSNALDASDDDTARSGTDS